MNAHDGNEVEDVGDAYVLVCGCGWRSAASTSAADVGREWDHHRAAVRNGN